MPSLDAQRDHGTPTGYGLGCRCVWCKEAKRTENRLRYDKRRATGLCVNCGLRPIATHAWSAMKVRQRKRQPHAVCIVCLRKMALVNADRPEMGAREEGWRYQRIEATMPPSADDLSYLEQVAGEPLVRTGATHGEIRVAGPPHFRLAYALARRQPPHLARSWRLAQSFLAFA